MKAMKKMFTLLLLSVLTTTGVMAQDTWTIAGSSAICSGKSWDTSATENDMIKENDPDFDMYKLVKTDCVLEKGTTYECKVVKNHSWNESYPATNYQFTVESTGRYTVTFSFNSTVKDLSVTTTKTGEAVIGDKSWTVAGTPESLFGTQWDPTNTNNDMEKQSDGTYLLEIKNATLPIGTVEYKICANHSWDEAYGNNGQNATLSIAEDGVYNVTFTFNPTTKAVGAESVKQGSAQIDKAYSLAGAFQTYNGEEWVNDDEATTMLFGQAWSADISDNDMMADDNNPGNYFFEKTSLTLPEGQIACKVVVNHSWGENYGADGTLDGDNVIATISQAGIYDVRYDFNPTTKILTITPKLIATGITNISDGQNAKAVRYDLSGRRVDKSAKGVVIVEGKKVMQSR